MADRPPITYSIKPPKGEAQVWLTAMGLAIGIVMVVGLLGLILQRGTDVFWPKRVVEIQLKDGTKLLSEHVLTQKNVKTGHDEWLIHSGNKSSENPGTTYRYVDTGEITGTTEPADVMKAERMEYGSAIFYPVSLTARDGSTLKAGDAGFMDKLESLMKTGASERKQVEHLEKKEIGRINQKIQDIDIKTRTHPDRAESLAAEKTALQAEYEKLAVQAKELHAALEKDILRCRLVGGEEHDQAIGQIVRIYEPNKLGFGGRLSVAIGQFKDFILDDPRESNTEGGIFPAIFGTFVMTILMSLLVTPLGVIAAIYLREYARQGMLVQVVRISVNNLAGVPSIVFGVFGLGFFVYTIGSHVDQWFFSDSLPTPTFGTGGILWASLTLALLTLPVVIVATEEALASVPRGVREAALACGASKWQAIQRVVLPASAPGVLTGVILAMARGAGEVAPLMLVGVIKSAPALPLDGQFPFIHADRKFMHMGFHIFDVGFQSPDSLAAQPMVYATTLLLITLVVVMNLSAILLRNKLRKKYAAGTF